MAEPGEIAKQICMEKSIDWAYEEEERLFLSDLEQNLHYRGKDHSGYEIILNEYPKEAIKSVYISMNAKKETFIKVFDVFSKF